MSTSLLTDSHILAAFRQPRRLTVSQWADEHRVLDERFAAEAGRWRTDRAPYAREWMDSATCKWVRRVSIMASTQVGKTEAANNVLGYFVHQQPAPAMLVMPRADDARLAAERRILPMIHASPGLRDELTDRAHDTKAREIAFRRSVLYFRAAQSPADLASVPVRVICGDEIDKWPAWTGKEANPLSLLAERTHTYPRSHLIFLTSTPTTRDGLIAREYEDGDQRSFLVPCPHCQTFQALRWRNLHWDRERITTARDMRVERKAWFACERCGGQIEDEHKPAMMRAGVWVPRHYTLEQWLAGAREADRVEHRSYHIWAAYSPWLPWWRVAAEFLSSKDEPSRLMNFTNSWLAEVWEERLDDVGDEAVAACLEQRRQREVPPEVQLITGSVDVQKDRLEWSVHGWGLNEETWLLAAGKVTTWEELAEAVVLSTWGDRKLRPRAVLIDSRYRRDEVIHFARQFAPVVRMIAGVERDSPIPFGTQRLDRHPRTGAVMPGMQVWTINVGMFKDLAHARLARALEKDAGHTGRIHLPIDLPEDYVKQLSSEHKVRQRSGSRMRTRWTLRPGQQRNEAWDLLVYQIAAARMIRADLLRDDAQLVGLPAAPTPSSPPRRDPRREPRSRFPLLGGR